MVLRCNGLSQVRDLGTANGWWRRRSRRQTSDDQVVDSYLRTADMVVNYYALLTNLLGNPEMPYDTSSNWSTVLVAAMADNSSSGSYLTPTEATAVINTLPTDSVLNASTLQEYMLYYNRSIEAIATGNNSGSSDGMFMNVTACEQQIAQLQDDTAAVITDGFPNIIMAHEYTSAAVQAAAASPSRAGVCAVVRLRITQDLTLTRTAFEARLELENSADSDLTNVSVTFDITKAGDNNGSYTTRFSIGNPTLTMLTGANGTGTLAAQSSGVASWVIVPYVHDPPPLFVNSDVGVNMHRSHIDATWLSIGTDKLYVDPLLFLNSNVVVNIAPFFDVHLSCFGV